MAPLIRVIGSMNADMLSVTPRFPELGETIRATSFSSSAGGKGANQAVACSRLARSRPLPSTSHLPAQGPDPVDVQLFGAVGGRDAHYQTLLQPTLESSGVNLSLVKVQPDDHTGVSVIAMSTSEGDNRIFFSPGANYSGMQPTPDVLGQVLKDPMPDLIVMQGETPTETLVAILRDINNFKLKNRGEAKERTVSGPEVVLNPAPAPPGGLPEDSLAAVDHLIMNETEAELMAPGPHKLSRVVPGAGDKERREQLALYYHKLGVSCVIVTLGSKGAWFSAAPPGSSIAADGTNRFTGAIPAAPVHQVLDTTAAGDTFVGGYATYIARWRESLRTRGVDVGALGRHERYYELTISAMKFGASAAARCVEKSGAMDSIPWEDEL